MTIAVKRQFQAAETDLHENVVRWPVTRERFLIALFFGTVPEWGK